MFIQHSGLDILVNSFFECKYYFCSLFVCDNDYYVPNILKFEKVAILNFGLCLVFTFVNYVSIWGIILTDIYSIDDALS